MFKLNSIMKKFILAYSVIGLIIFISVGIYACKEITNSPTDTTYSNPFIDDSSFVTVISVRDGDTFEFGIDRDTIAVRVLELDCFESRRGRRLDEQAASVGIDSEVALLIGLAAKNFAKEYLVGKKVKLIRDRNENNIDMYSRLLRKIYVDGKSYKETMCSQAFTVECYR